MSFRNGILAALLVIAPFGSANAVTFDVFGINESPDNKATVSFEYDASLAQISIGITNLAPFGARITGFGFNAPSSVTGVSSFTASGTQDNSDWNAEFEPSVEGPPKQGIKATEQLYFDIAGVTGPNLTGGKANSGIAVGDTGSFTFTLLGSGLASLTEMSFLSLLADDSDPRSAFGVRFQRTGSDGRGSDFAIGGPAPIPVPAALPLLGSVLGGLGLMGWNRRRRQQVSADGAAPAAA